MHLDRNGLEMLDEAECRGLLASATVGRVGLSMGGRIVILPVNFGVLDGNVVFRSAPGSKLLAAVANQELCFEVDGVDPDRRQGWSVLVTGRAEVIEDERDIERSRALPLNQWLAVPHGPYVRVRSHTTSGRRLPSAAAQVGV